jgi:mannose-6-phosphate isomerase-like protein (cupin superfamily)
VLATFKTPLHAVRLMRLTAGSAIKEHSDHDLSFEDGTVRFHIPVVTNPYVEFYLNGERVVLEAGSCWYLRLADPHRVVNGGSTDRVHMVIDAEANDWVGSVLQQAARGAMRRREDAAAVGEIQTRDDRSTAFNNRSEQSI